MIHSMMESVSMESVLDGIRRLPMPDVDAVVALERGGLIPGALIAAWIDKPLGRIRIQYRDDNNDIQHETPQLLGDPTIPGGNTGHLLLVDDVCVTGKTLLKARAVLGEHRVTTLVLRGSADLIVFPGLEACVAWPWSHHRTGSVPSFAGNTEKTTVVDTSAVGTSAASTSQTGSR